MVEATEEREPEWTDRPATDDGSTGQTPDHEVGTSALGATQETARASLIARDGRETDAGRGWAWKGTALVGALALVGGVAALVAPASAVAAVDTSTAELLRAAIGFLAAAVGLFAVGVLFVREQSEAFEASDPVELPTENPEARLGTDETTVGTELDAAIDEMDGMVEAGSLGDVRNAREATSYLRSLAVRVLVEQTDWSTSTARERIDDGTWTDDPRAAALLGGSDAPPRPLSIRFRDWANGERFSRQVEATVDELVRLTEGEEP